MYLCLLPHPHLHALSLLKLLAVLRFSFGISPRLRNGYRVVGELLCGNELPNGFLERCRWVEIPPPQKKKKDSARRATLLLFFLRRALEGMARYVVQIPWIGSLHTRHIVNGCKSFSHWLSSMSSLPLQFRTTSLADVESSHMRMKAATLAVCIRSST
jgi:hypothetical protein